jgi:glycoside hydrolase-like protein
MGNALDYAWSRPDPQVLVDSGYHAVGRYLTDAPPPGGTPGKRLTIAEAHALHAHGLTIFLLFEETSRQWLNGRDQGHSDALKAQLALSTLMVPSTAAVYFAIDEDVEPDHLPVAEAYLLGAESVLGVGRVGVYGGFRVVNAACATQPARRGFQTYAWSSREHIYGDLGTTRHDVVWSGHAQIRQVLNGAHLGAAEVDVCQVVDEDYHGWHPLPPAPSPAPEPPVIQPPADETPPVHPEVPPEPSEPPTEPTEPPTVLLDAAAIGMLARTVADDLADDPGFIDRLGLAIAAKQGPPATAEQIAAAVVKVVAGKLV